jgi:hypothetical protein
LSVSFVRFVCAASAIIENKIKENTGVNASIFSTNQLTIHCVNIRIQIEQTEISLCIFCF